MRWAALLAASGVALAGCSGGDRTSSDHATQTQSTTAASEQSAGGSAEPGSARQDSDDSSTDSSGSQAPTDAKVARTVNLSITVDDIDKASAQVRSAARTADGYVSSEDSRAATYPGGRAWAEITVTVPVTKLDSTTTDLAEIGEVTKRSSSAEDLTTQYTDTAARVKTKTKAVERLRKLIDSTEDLDQIVTLEDELATREADLESMTSQQKALEKRTATAPITVSLSTERPEADDEPEDATGFVAGLKAGWGAFTDSMTVALTVLGAVTPFAVVLAVVLAPLGWWLRRRRRTARAATGS